MGATSDASSGADDLRRDAVDRFRAEVAERVPDDVEVRPTPDGFAVGYPEPLVMTGARGPSATCLWAKVACDPTTFTYRITDTVTGAEVDFFERSSSVSGFRGRMVGDRSVREHGTLPDGTRGLLRVQVHSPRVLHTAIREPAAELGWQEKQPAAALAGMVVAIGTGGALLVAGIVVGALALMGRLG